jgi:hypothetical protein
MLDGILLAARSGRSSSGGTAVIVVVLGLAVVAVALFWWFDAKRRVLRRLRRVPVRSIRDLMAGSDGRVIGSVCEHETTLKAPLSGRRCVYYSVIVRAKSGKHWRTIIEEGRGVPFVLEDGSGRVLIDPVRAEVALDFDRHGTSGTFDDADPTEEAFLRRHAESSKGLIFNRSMRYQEAVIEVGELLVALGTIRRARGPTADLPPLTGTAERRLILSDCREAQARG